MTINEAIEILSICSNEADKQGRRGYRDAFKLGIEALKRLAFNRLNTIASSDELLPGETKE